MTTTLKPATRPRTGTAAVYSRVSSLETQRADCARYCSSRGLVATHHYVDLQSGLKSDRVQYQEMLSAAVQGEFDNIIVWKLDRFGRDRIESGIQIRELGKVGVAVESASEPNDSPLLRNILMDFAEEESRRISLRVSANKRTRSLDGKRSSVAPFGFKNVPHPTGGITLEANDDAPIVVEVFRRYASGQHTLASLRDYIVEAGASPTKPKTRGSVHNLLKNPAYAGKLRHGAHARSNMQVKSPAQLQGEVFEVEGTWPALIDEETFAAVQQKLRFNQKTNSGRPHSKLLFAGLIWCSCGARYTGHRDTGQHEDRGPRAGYYCNRRMGQGTCTAPSVREPRLRAAVIPPLQAALKRFSEEDVRTAVRGEVERQRQEGALAERQSEENLGSTITRLEARLTALEDAYLDGDIGRERYIVRRDQITAQIDDARAKLGERMAPDLLDVEALFAAAEGLSVENLDDLSWRTLIEATIDKIVIEDGVINVHWKPEYQALLS